MYILWNVLIVSLTGTLGKLAGPSVSLSLSHWNFGCDVGIHTGQDASLSTSIRTLIHIQGRFTIDDLPTSIFWEEPIHTETFAQDQTGNHWAVTQQHSLLCHHKMKSCSQDNTLLWMAVLLWKQAFSCFTLIAPSYVFCLTMDVFPICKMDLHLLLKPRLLHTFIWCYRVYSFEIIFVILAFALKIVMCKCLYQITVCFSGCFDQSQQSYDALSHWGFTSAFISVLFSPYCAALASLSQ